MPTSDGGATFRKVFQVAYILLASAFGLIWLHRDPLSAYWQQRFLRPISWAKIAYSPEAAPLPEQTIPQCAVDEPDAPADPSPPAAEEISAPEPESTPESTPEPPVTDELDEPDELNESDESNPQEDPDETGIWLSPQGKVLLAGDSMMQGVAPHLMRMLKKDRGIKSVNLSRHSTGLTYSHFFDWPKNIENTLAGEKNIELLIVFLGANDTGSMQSDDGARYLKFRGVSWEKAYRGHIRNILEAARRHHCRVIWVGLPNMRKASLSSGVNYLNTLYYSEATEARQMYVSVNDLFAYDDNVYSDHLKENGKIRLRDDDGIHFTIAGQKRIAEHLFSAIRVSEPENVGMTRK